jgi:hypothetical protein
MSIKERGGEVAPAEFGHEFFGIALRGQPGRGGALDRGRDAAG